MDRNYEQKNILSAQISENQKNLSLLGERKLALSEKLEKENLEKDEIILKIHNLELQKLDKEKNTENLRMQLNNLSENARLRNCLLYTSRCV